MDRDPLVIGQLYSGITFTNFPSFCISKASFTRPVFDRAGANRTGESTTWNFVHTSQFSTGRQVPIIAGQSSGTKESIGVFTQPGRFTGRVKIGVCVNVSISNTCTPVDSSTGRRTGLVVDSSGYYPGPGQANDQVVCIGLCFPVFHYFGRSKTGTCEGGLSLRSPCLSHVTASTT
jgi:hypothetical protein